MTLNIFTNAIDRASLSQQGSKMADTAPAPEASEKSSSFPLAVPPLIPALRLESPDGVQSEAETPSKKGNLYTGGVKTMLV